MKFRFSLYLCFGVVILLLAQTATAVAQQERLKSSDNHRISSDAINEGNIETFRNRWYGINEAAPEAAAESPSVLENPLEGAHPQSPLQAPPTDDNDDNDDDNDQRMNSLEIAVIVIAVLAGTLLIVLIAVCVIRNRVIEIAPVEIPLLSQVHGRSTAARRSRASTIYADVPFPDEIPRSSFADAVFIDIGSPKPKNQIVRSRQAKVGNSILGVLTVSTASLDRDMMEKYILAGENVVYLLSKRSNFLVQFIHVTPTPVGSELRLFHEMLPFSLKRIVENYKVDNRRLSCAAIEKISLGILEGLAALHHQAPPMLHGNLAIDQIFVDIDPSNGDVRQVKVNPPSNLNPWIPQSECYQITLCPELMSIRQSGNQNATTFMADIFSFGLILFELISMQSPYADMDPPAIKKALSQGRRPSFPSNVNFADYLNLISVFMDCTEMEPWYRPSAANLLRDPRLRHSRTKTNVVAV